MTPIIYIIEDDHSVRVAFERLMISAGLEAITFASAEDFLASECKYKAGCLITDIKMKGLSGFELHIKLKGMGNDIPVIYITGYDTPESRDQAKSYGASGYLCKPIDDQALLDAIKWAVNKP